MIKSTRAARKSDLNVARKFNARKLQFIAAELYWLGFLIDLESLSRILYLPSLSLSLSLGEIDGGAAATADIRDGAVNIDQRMERRDICMLMRALVGR